MKTIRVMCSARERVEMMYFDRSGKLWLSGLFADVRGVDGRLERGFEAL